MTERIVTVRWLSHGDMVPEGWVYADHKASHHTNYGNLIMKTISRETARELGLHWYFTGRPCARGHIATRSVGNRNCAGCLAHYREEKKRIEQGLPIFVSGPTKEQMMGRR